MRLFKILLFFLISGTAFGQSGASMMMTSATAPVVDTFLLDSFPADAAYALVCLKASMLDSACIRVRRSSDNAEQDIGFLNTGFLDTVDLKSFVGVNDGYVVKAYDLSGFERDIIQPTATAQPKIVSSGVIERLGGHPAILFDGTDDRLEGNYLSNTSHSVLSITDLTGLDATTICCNEDGKAGDWVIRKNLYFVRFFNSNSDIDNVTNATLSGQGLCFNIWDGTIPANINTLPPDGTISSYQNDSLTDDSASDSNYNVFKDGFMVGYGFTYFDNHIQEVVVYLSDQSANKTAISNNRNRTYSIY